MTEGAQIALVVLIALLVGAALPVLYQLHRVLRSARLVLTNADQHLERVLAQVTEAAGRVDRVIARAEDDAERLRPLVDGAASLGRGLQQLQGTLRPLAAVGVAVGPAIVAAMRAIFAPPAADRQQSAPAEPEPAMPYRPASLQPDRGRFQSKEGGHHE